MLMLRVDELPPNVENVEVLRVVMRETFTEDLGALSLSKWSYTH
jgi:hypothetical protein